MNPDRDPLERLELRLPVRPESVPTGRQAAARFAEAAGFPETAVGRVRLAVSEALTNVVLHAHRDGETSRALFELAGSTSDGRLVITVTDRGTGLRPRDDSPGVGLGLALMAKSSDELQLESGPDGGTVVRMAFLR